MRLDLCRVCRNRRPCGLEAGSLLLVDVGDQHAQQAAVVLAHALVGKAEIGTHGGHQLGHAIHDLVRIGPSSGSMMQGWVEDGTWIQCQELAKVLMLFSQTIQ